MKYLEEKHNWDIHTKNNCGDDVYLFASANGQIESMKYLEETNHWDIYTKNNYDDDAYLVAAAEGQIKVMKYLEEKHRWDIHTKNKYGDDAYIQASENGQINVVEYLKEKRKHKNCFSMERINETKECSICLEEFGGGNVCSICENSNVFHRKCFSKEIENKCSVCRGKMMDFTITK